MQILSRKIRRIFVAIVVAGVLMFRMPVYANSATLFFSPGSGTFGAGNFTTSVYIDTGDQSVNSVSGTISFPADKIDVSSVSVGGSIIDTWIVNPGYSNSEGIISFEGLILMDPFHGANGKILSVTFTPKTQGVVVLWFSEAAVLAADSEGTNILQGAGSATFTLGLPKSVSAPAVLEPELRPSALEPESKLSAALTAQVTNPVVKGDALLLPGYPVVSSPTHSDPEQWYRSNDPKFEWNASGLTGVNIYGDQNPNTFLGERSDGLFRSYTFHDVEDGIWYFHIRFQNANGWGNTTHRKFKIDTTPPAGLEIRQMEERTDGRADFELKAEDLLSGLSYFEIFVDGGESFVRETSGKTMYTTPILRAGEHKLKVIAFDNLDNSVSKEMSFVIPEHNAQKTGEAVAKLFQAAPEVTHSNVSILSSLPLLDIANIILTFALGYMACLFLMKTRKR